MLIEGFPPICRPDARTLILGSMPSRESLARQRYYAHPRNGFWPILCDLLGITATDYDSMVEAVKKHGIAIWDVLKACHREGSLDSAIDDLTIVTNDFPAFFAEHPRITRVFFNGMKAEAVFRKHVLPSLPGAGQPLRLQRLPSTSPAHAGLGLDQKKAAWRVIAEDC